MLFWVMEFLDHCATVLEGKHSLLQPDQWLLRHFPRQIMITFPFPILCISWNLSAVKFTFDLLSGPNKPYGEKIKNFNNCRKAKLNQVIWKVFFVRRTFLGILQSKDNLLSNTGGKLPILIIGKYAKHQCFPKRYKQASCDL